MANPDVKQEKEDPRSAAFLHGPRAWLRTTGTYRSILLRFLGTYGTIAVLVVMLVAFSLVEPGTFATIGNFRNILNDMAIGTIVAGGLTVPLVAGDFDLSIGYVASFCGLLLVFAVGTWLPTIMQASGYSIGSALLQTAVMWVGAGAGMVAGGRIADGVGIKPVVVVAFLVGSASLLGMSARPPLVALFLLMFVSGLGFIGSQVLTNAFIVTRYPEHLRGAGIGWALSVGRLGAILGPSMGGWILSSGLGVQWNFYLFAVPGLLGALAAVSVPAVLARRGGLPVAAPPASSPAG